MNYEVDFSQSIAKSLEAKVLNKPFKVGKNAYAVFTKDANEKIVRIDFSAKATIDAAHIGPKYSPNYWSAKMDASVAEADNTKLKTLNELADFYLNENVAPENRDKDLNEWNGKDWYSAEDILKCMPSLKNVPPAYKETLPLNKTPNEGSSVKPNTEPLAEQKKTTD